MGWDAARGTMGSCSSLSPTSGGVGTTSGMRPQHRSGGFGGAGLRPGGLGDPRPLGRWLGITWARPRAAGAPVDLPPAGSPARGGGTVGERHLRRGRTADGTMLGTGGNNSADGKRGGEGPRAPRPPPRLPPRKWPPAPGGPGRRNPARPVSGLGCRRQEPAPSRPARARLPCRPRSWGARRWGVSLGGVWGGGEHPCPPATPSQGGAVLWGGHRGLGMARGDPSLSQALYLRRDLCRGRTLPLPFAGRDRPPQTPYPRSWGQGGPAGAAPLLPCPGKGLRSLGTPSPDSATILQETTSPASPETLHFGAGCQPFVLVFTNYFLFLKKCPHRPQRRVLECDRRGVGASACRGLGAACAGRERDRKHRPRVYPSLNNSLACAVSPRRPSAVSGTKGRVSGGRLGGRKEEKKERRSPPGPSPCSHRPGWNPSGRTLSLLPAAGPSPGWAIPCGLPLLYFFPKYGNSSPREAGGSAGGVPSPPPPPRPCCCGPWGGSLHPLAGSRRARPKPVSKRREESRECRDFLAMGEKKKNIENYSPRLENPEPSRGGPGGGVNSDA